MKKIIIFLFATSLFAIQPKPSKKHTEKDGMYLYLQNCVTCHAWDGKGAFCGVPDLTTSYSPLRKPTDALVHKVIAGSANRFISMPPKGGNARLTNEDIRNILKFMKRKFVK